MPSYICVYIVIYYSMFKYVIIIIIIIIITNVYLYYILFFRIRKYLDDLLQSTTVCTHLSIIVYI